MALKLITAPVALAVSLIEAKAHLRVDSADDDTLITAMIGAATEMAEQKTGRAMMAQTWELSLDSFWNKSTLPKPNGYPNPLSPVLELTRVPVQTVTSITYTSTAGVSTLYSSLLYVLDITDDYGAAYINPAYGSAWPATRNEANAVKVRYVAGYASAAAVPESIKSWIKLMVGAMYENREAEVVANGSAISLGFADHLLDRYKAWI